MKLNLLKKLLILVLIFCLAAAFTACGNGSQDETPAGDDTAAGSEATDSGETEESEEPEPQEEPEEPEEPEQTEEPEVKEEPKEEEKQPQPQQPTGQKGDGSDYGVPIVSTLESDDGNLLVLVNKQYAVGRNYYPTDMVDIDGSLSTNQNLKVKREAYDAYLKMLADAKAEGLNFCICSAYRGFEVQESLYYNSLASNGKAYTDKMFAYPGRSEHHTGYAIDITSASMNWGLSQNYADYPDGAWIAEHCDEYGFIIRYPKGKEDITGYMYEPWHIRYVGLDIAKEITDAGITFEEYMGVA